MALFWASESETVFEKVEPMDNYVGSELKIFETAVTWKSYFGRQVQPWLGRRVIEVGAGIGGTTSTLATGKHDEWICLEPDAKLLAEITAKIAEKKLPDFCRPMLGTLEAISPDASVDTILYMDVLEHIADDSGEVRCAFQRLRSGGSLVILSPSHQFLYSPFDKAVGHCRRYTRATLKKAIGNGGELQLLRYLDSAGFFLSLGNRLILSEDTPSLKQIQFWDRFAIPISRVIDPLLAYNFGKSILGVWKKL